MHNMSFYEGKEKYYQFCVLITSITIANTFLFNFALYLCVLCDFISSLPQPTGIKRLFCVGCELTGLNILSQWMMRSVLGISKYFGALYLLVLEKIKKCIMEQGSFMGSYVGGVFLFQ